MRYEPTSIISSLSKLSRKTLALALAPVAIVVLISACGSATPSVTITPAAMNFGPTELTKEGTIAVTGANLRVETQIAVSGPFNIVSTCAGTTVTPTMPCKFTIRAEGAGTGELQTKMQGIAPAFSTSLTK